MTIWRKLFTLLIRPLGDKFANTECSKSTKHITNEIQQTYYKTKTNDTSENITEDTYKQDSESS